MRKFKCVKNYPGADLGTIVQYQLGTFPEYFDIKDAKRYNKRDIENYPEFWQEVVEKDYEILSERTHIPSGSTEIYSIRRKSDGVEFKIGDKVCWDWQYSSQKYYTINKFFIREEDNSIGFYTKESCAYSWLFNKIQHYKEPILTTEDGYECTLDDRVFGVLPKGSWETNYYGKKGVPVFKLFNPEGKRWNPSSEWLWFKTKENAEKYIYENKPEFSRKQILEALDYAKYAGFSQEKWIIASKIKEKLKL